MPIYSADKSILLGQAVVDYQADVVEGSQFVIVLNDKTRMRLSDQNMQIFSDSSTTFYNTSTEAACFAKFQSTRSGCFIGTSSYSPFAVLDAASKTLLSVNSTGIFSAAGDIKSNNGKFRGQAYTTNSAEEGDPEIKMDSSPQQIEMEAGGKLCVVVNENYVRSMVDIQTAGISGQVSPTTDARIDLGESFVVSKGDFVERFSVNVQSGAIKQTTSAYTAFVIDGSNATGALIRTSCGASTYNFGATNLGWLVMDNAFNPLLTVSDIDIKAQNNYVPQGPSSLVTRKFLEENGASGELPISSEDSSVTLDSPKKDEFEVSLAGEMKLRITENDIQTSPGYQPRSDTSLVTKRFLYGQGDGNNPIVPPGQDSGASWQTIVVDQNDYPPSQARLQHHVLACDGVFTIGFAWSVNGFDWFNASAGVTKWNEKAVSRDGGHFIVKGRIGGADGTNMYMTGDGGSFSYNVKSWINVPNNTKSQETNGSLTWYWNNDFFLNKYDTNAGASADDSGRIPESRRAVSWQAAMRYDYSTGQWSITRKEAEVWFYGQTQATPSNGYADAADIPSISYPCSRPDGGMVIGVQKPFTYNNSSPDTAPRLCYIKSNPSQNINSPTNSYQASWEVIPQLAYINASVIQGIAYDEADDRWVFITDSQAYSCQGNPSVSTWRSVSLPATANWSEGFHYNGIHFVAVSAGTNGNLGIYSEDGMTWNVSSNLVTNSEYTACGTNGRSILSGIKADGAAATFTYALTPLHVSSEIDTAGVTLTNPVDVVRSDDTSPTALLKTQEDANQYFADQVEANAETASNASQDASSALSKAKVNEQSINGMSEAIEANIAEIAKKAEIRVLTQAQYDAIPSNQLDAKTLYCISD